MFKGGAYEPFSAFRVVAWVSDFIVPQKFWLPSVGILLISASLYAQSNQGRILGAVRDQSGGTIAGATVTVTDTLKGVSRTLTTDEAGEYAAPNLDPSTYSIRVEFKGFKTYDRQGLDIAVGQEAKIDVTMQTGRTKPDGYGNRSDPSRGNYLGYPDRQYRKLRRSPTSR